MQIAMTHGIRHIGVHAAAALMALLVVLCVAAGVGAAGLVGGAPGLALGPAAALATFQALRVPVGRAARWLVDG
jgi:hypothetical protein